MQWDSSSTRCLTIGCITGLGMMAYDLPEATWVGHSGGIPGAKAVVVYSLEQGTYAAVALTGEGSAESIARQFMSAVEKP
jgi:D-alanyl-D-alanine carboxypeptidase